MSRLKGFFALRPALVSAVGLGLPAIAALLVWADAAQASFPGGNGKIAFTSDRDGNNEIYVMATDGSNQTRLTNNAGGDDLAAFSSDGQKIAFVSGRDGNNEIYVMNADGSGQTRLTSNSVFDSRPAWSPDGDKIAFVRPAADGYDEIWVMNADGSGQTRLTNNSTVTDTTPAFSPDGSTILFASTRHGDGEADDGEIYRMNANGSSPAPLTENTVADCCPDSSPDGQKIAFQRTSGNGQVYVMDANGSGQTNVSNNAVQDSRPAFSPDGQKIAFSSLRDGTNEIYVMNANGSNQTRLTNNTALDTEPDWQPQPTPVIFVHGFLASKLECAGAGELWPHISALDRPQLGAMELGTDGITTIGDGSCTGAVQTNGVVDSVNVGPISADIHGSTLSFLDRIASGANYVYAWDWRKSPEQALAGLDTLIDTVRTANGGRKVAILAHSFGGLLTRWYIDDPSRAAKVARAMIVGTPSWGSPKALFPLATGQETPSGGDLDRFFDQTALKSFSRNLMGAYFLYPSANYGTWLTVQGRVPSVLDTQQKVIDYVNNDLLGNGTLLGGAFDAHDNVLDGWETNGVDVRAVVGTGVNTVIGVDLIPDASSSSQDLAELRFGNGDQTVPARSATQGTPGTSNPLGEDIPIVYECNISHVPLAGDTALTDAGARQFLILGEDLTAPTQPCSNGGFSIEVYDVTIGPAAATRMITPRAGIGESLVDAEAAGDIDLIRFPSVAFAVTDDFNPVTLDIPDAAAHVVVRRLDGETQGAPQSFGPFADGIELKTTAGGEIDVGAIPQAPTTPAGGTTVPQAAATGRRAAALRKCKKVKPPLKRRKCKKRARKLPV